MKMVYKYRQFDLWDRIEKSEISLHINGNSVYDTSSIDEPYRVDEPYRIDEPYRKIK